MADGGAQSAERQQGEQQGGSGSEQGGQSRVADRARETATRAAQSAAGFGQGAAQHYVKEPARDLFSLLRDYSRDKPDVAALWCFAIGLFVGWKLKP